MPIFELQIKASLENVEKVYAPSSIYWRIRFSCVSCNELGRNAIEFSAEDVHEAGRGKFNITSRCQFCGRLRTADVVPQSEQPYIQSDQPNFKTVIKFECRGMEPVEYNPGEGWIVESMESGEVFNDVDLKDSEWAEYDSKRQCPVGIYSLEHRFIKEK